MCIQIDIQCIRYYKLLGLHFERNWTFPGSLCHFRLQSHFNTHLHGATPYIHHLSTKFNGLANNGLDRW